MKTPYKTLAVLAFLIVAVALVIAQPAPDQSIRQTAFYQQVMESLQVAGLANPPLYPDSSGTVQGWTNASPLTITNDTRFSRSVIADEVVSQSFTVQTNGVIDLEGGPASNSGTNTRASIFGAPGLSATITNSGTVYVFTNGILASTNAP
jgi:hypothetical protein